MTTAPGSHRNPTPEYDTRRRIVLVAEDDLELRALVSQGLARCGYEVVAVADGARLIERLEPLLSARSTQPRPDLVVTDLRLPKYSGLEVLELVKLLDRRLPVIVITAFANRTTRAVAETLGASAFLEKPFDMGELIRVAQRCAPLA